MFLLSKKHFFPQHVSCKSDQLAINSLNFCLRKVLLSPSLWKGNMAGKTIIGCWIFLSQHFKYFTLLSSCLYGYEGMLDIILIFVLQLRCFSSLWSLPRFFPYTADLLSLSLVCLGADFQHLPCLVFSELPESLISDINLGKIMLLLKILLLFLSLFLLCWHSYNGIE